MLCLSRILALLLDDVLVPRQVRCPPIGHRQSASHNLQPIRQNSDTTRTDAVEANHFDQVHSGFAGRDLAKAQ